MNWWWKPIAFIGVIALVSMACLLMIVGLDFLASVVVFGAVDETRRVSTEGATVGSIAVGALVTIMFSIIAATNGKGWGKK